MTSSDRTGINRADANGGEQLPAGLPSVVATADPIPFDVLRSLRANFGRRSLDAEVAELVYDSVLDETAGVRGGGGPRQLSFEGPHVNVEMAVVHERSRVIGQLVPPLRGEVEVRQTSGSYVVEVDETGGFVTKDVPKGPVSFRCSGDDGGRSYVTVTDWVTL